MGNERVLGDIGFSIINSKISECRFPVTIAEIFAVDRTPNKKESLNPPTAVKEYVSGEGFFYLGRSYRLKLVDGVKGQPPLRLYQSRFELQQEAQAQGREAFIRWYCDRMRVDFRYTNCCCCRSPRSFSPFGASTRLRLSLGFLRAQGRFIFSLASDDATANHDRVCSGSRVGVFD